MSKKITAYIGSVRTYIKKHKRRLPTLALLIGFLWDALTLGRPDQIFDNVVLLFYIVLAGVGILFINYYKERRGGDAPLWQLLLVQFSFGNLASALFILYGKSGSLIGNWPFLLLLLVLILNNEFLQKKFHNMRAQIAVYFLLVFAYFVLIVPVLFRQVGVGIFLISGALSIFAIAAYLFSVHLIAPRRMRVNKCPVLLLIGGIFVGMNMLYFLNLIPPVPLALRDIGIYHHVERTLGGDYTVAYERGAWYEFWKRSDKVFHYTPGDTAYCFSSVFAPARLSTPIFHRWEFYNESTKVWENQTYISFSILGGREGGFRGFSKKSALTAGKWRCSVENERGALVGRRSFEVLIGGDFDLIFDTL